jgi:hypothetical protein
MMATLRAIAILLLHAQLGMCLVPASSPVVGGKQRGVLTWMRGGAVEPEVHDFSKDASGIFGNIRLASLFPGGAIIGQAFAIPLMSADTFAVGIVKRLYLLVAVSSLSSSLISVVYSSAAINRLSLAPSAPAVSLRALLERDFEFFWTGCNVHFNIAVVGLASMVATRAWLTFGCPVFGRVGGLLVFSAVLQMVSALGDDGAGAHPLSQSARHAVLLWRRARCSPLTAASVGLGALCLALTADAVPHVYSYIHAVG